MERLPLALTEGEVRPTIGGEADRLPLRFFRERNGARRCFEGLVQGPCRFSTPKVGGVVGSKDHPSAVRADVPARGKKPAEPRRLELDFPSSSPGEPRSLEGR